LFIGFNNGALKNGAISLTERFSHDLHGLRTGDITHFGKFTCNNLHGHFAGNFTSGMASHAISDDEEPTLLIGVGIETVFIACADSPDISAGGDG
jgi:hypothetical protein